MKSIKLLITIFTCLTLFSSPAAHAQMTRKQQARAQFQKGMVFFKSGKYLQAIREMKDAYNLIPKPVVLYFIAEVYKEAGLKEEAITYYQKFLANARVNDKTGFRKKAKESIKSLGGKQKGPDLSKYTYISNPPKKDYSKKDDKKDKKQHKKIKKRKFKKGELIHTPLEEAKPNHPAKLETELPPSIKRAWVYVYYRKFGESKFNKAKMKVDKNDIYFYILPCKAMTGNILQYYIEAVGVNGRRIAGAATNSSPFIVDINKANPLQPGGKLSCSDGTLPGPGTGPAPGTDFGSETTTRPKSFYLAVGTSIATAALFGVAVAMGSMAIVQGQNLENNQMARNPANTTDKNPARRYTTGIIPFSGNIADYENKGKSYESTMFLTGGIAVVTGLATLYFWLDYLKIIPKNYSLDAKVFSEGGTVKQDSKSFTIAPIIGNNTYGIGGSINF
ncbi:MAG: tetratricopeptide repeat protein [Deltaproteobacteria bacterium]|nr:tetratricopeptide repeat protein [Deltaproteobacteria bacterium]